MNHAILVCLRCKGPIEPELGVKVVRLSNGVMHDACHVEHTYRVAQMIERATAEGRHSNVIAHVVEDAYQWAGRLSAGFDNPKSAIDPGVAN